MAHGFLEQEEGFSVWSAGVEPHGVNARAVAIMGEHGIDISQHTCNHVDEYKDLEFDCLLFVCDRAKEMCPVFLRKKSIPRVIHQSFRDPAAAKGTEQEIMDEFRSVSAEIREYCSQLSKDLQQN